MPKNFIPQLWEAQYLEHLEEEQVATNFVNRNYEGDITNMGDTVVVNQIGKITVSDYDPDTGLSDPEALSATAPKLLIDRAKSFNFIVDDIEKVQAAGDLMDESTKNSAQEVGDVVDKDIFSVIAASAGNVIGSDEAPIEITVENAYDYLIQLRALLRKAKAPSGEWRLAVPTDFYSVLLKDDRFVKAGTDAGEERLANGFVGRIAGFDVYETNNTPVIEVEAVEAQEAVGEEGDPDYQPAVAASDGYTVQTVIATYPGATSYASQIVKTETLKTTKKFGDVVRGLNVYGVKTFRPECVEVLKFKV